MPNNVIHRDTLGGVLLDHLDAPLAGVGYARLAPVGGGREDVVNGVIKDSLRCPFRGDAPVIDGDKHLG